MNSIDKIWSNKSMLPFGKRMKLLKNFNFQYLDSDTFVTSIYVCMCVWEREKTICIFWRHWKKISKVLLRLCEKLIFFFCWGYVPTIIHPVSFSIIQNIMRSRTKQNLLYIKIEIQNVKRLRMQTEALEFWSDVAFCVWNVFQMQILS